MTWVSAYADDLMPILVFIELYRDSKVDNKGLCREEQNKFIKKSYIQWWLILGP